MYLVLLLLLKRNWTLVGACHSLVAVNGVKLPAWRDYNEFASEINECSDLAVSLPGSARMRAMLKSGIWTITLLQLHDVIRKINSNTQILQTHRKRTGGSMYFVQVESFD